MQSAFASEQRRRTTFQAARLFMAMLVVVMTLAGLEQSARATQTPTQSWAPPNGAFTVQWQSPWEVHRQEAEMLAVANGSTIAIATTSVPAAEINPSICLEGYIAAVADPGIDPRAPVMEGKTSWRAYAAFDNLQVGSTDYYECQVTPDGQSMAVFAGGTTMMEKFANIPMLIEFLGQWVVREAGEAGPAVAADGWRLGVVDWVRGTVYQDLGLGAAPAGSDYLVVVADVTNWQANQTDLPLASINARATDSDTLIPVDLQASQTAAAALGESPVEEIVSIAPGETRRMVLAFLVNGDAELTGVSLGDSAAALVDDGITARLVMLPPNRALPATQSGVVSNVIDGRTLLVTLGDTGQSERVRLIGVGEPVGDAAAAYLATYVGQSVLLESDPVFAEEARLPRYVWAIDANGLPDMLNQVVIEQGLAPGESPGTGGRFAAMLASAGGTLAGSASSAPVASDQEPQADAAQAELTDADRAYLAKLVRSSDVYHLTLEYFDRHMGTPGDDAEFFSQLGILFVGWSSFYNDLTQLEPTPRFADLHARFLAAAEPFSALAYQIEPALDQVLAGQSPAQPLAGYDYQLMTSTVAAIRPALEAVLAEIDALLVEAGFVPLSGVGQ